MTLEHLLRAVFLGLLLAVLVGAARGMVGYGLWIHRGDAYRASLEYGRALDAFERAAALRPGSALPRLHAGEILVAQGRWEEAERVLSLALSSDPENPEIWVALGRTSLGQGDEGEAKRRWLEAVARDPSHGKAWLAVANLYISRSQWDRATEALEHATAGRTAEASAQYLMGLIQVWEDEDRALRHLELARARGDPELQERTMQAITGLQGLGGPPIDGDAWAELGQVYLGLSQPEMAYHAFGRSLDLGEDTARVRAFLGYAAWRLGLDAEAASHLRTARQQDPQDALPLYFLGLLYRSRGEADLALNSLQAALMLDPENPAFYAELGDLFHQEKEYVSAREAYLRATEAAPLNADFHLLRAAYHLGTLLWTGDAVEAAQAAVRLAPGESLAHEYLGWALYLSGELEAAEEALERAVGLDSASARSHYRLGVVRIAIGNSGEARRDLLRAVDLDPEGTYRRRAELALAELNAS